MWECFIGRKISCCDSGVPASLSVSKIASTMGPNYKLGKLPDLVYNDILYFKA